MIDDDLGDDLPLSTAVGDPGPVPDEPEEERPAWYIQPAARHRKRKPWRTTDGVDHPVTIRAIDWNGHVPGEAA